MKIISQKNKGFALLFAIMLSSIILAISIGVANIALKEVNFSTSAKDTNDAFFATDTGIECALMYDKSNPTNNACLGSSAINCAGVTIFPSGFSPNWNFIISGLGSSNQSCASVDVSKDLVNHTTSIISKGYDTGNTLCNSSNANRIERELRVNY